MATKRKKQSDAPKEAEITEPDDERPLSEDKQFLADVAAAANVPVPHVRLYLKSASTVICRNMPLDKYARLPDIVSFIQAKLPPCKRQTNIVKGQRVNFKARGVGKMTVRGHVVKALADAMA